MGEGQALDDERRSAIIRLLQHRDDHLPEPIHRTDSPASGFVHSIPDNTEACPDCLANDRTTFSCETCGGSGRVRTPRARDPYAVESVLPFGFDVSKHDLAGERDRQIAMLDRQLAPARSEADLLAEANAHPYAWEIARQHLYRDFDFGALDLALEQLREHDHDGYRALHAVYVYGWLTAPAGLAAAACERGLNILHALLPENLRAPAEPQPIVNLAARGRGADKRALAQRDAAIRQAIANQSTAEVAEAFALTVSQVNRIVSRAA